MDTPTPPILETRKTNGVVTLRLNRPSQFNALSEAMLQALHEQVVSW